MVENSPFMYLTEDDINSLRNFITSEEHLQRNIIRTELERVSKWEISVKMFVSTSKLCEGARPYIWKHLGGSNFWTRSNGTVIKLERIHVK